jgi:guanine nucleotide-binding protein G(o) subunit alpha
VHAQRDSEPFDDDLAQAMMRLWVDAGVQQCYKRNSDYQIDDSAK